MKLWKSKKSISCVPKKSSSPPIKRHEVTYDSNGLAAVDRSMSPAQSEDSGLAHERCTIYASITLPRESPNTIGIAFAERNDLSHMPVISAISPFGHAGDFLAPGDRILQVDGISTIGLTNQQVINLLCEGNLNDAGCSGSVFNQAVVEIEYSLPVNESQNSLCVTSKLAQIAVEREGGCLGLTLRGGGDYPLIVTHLRLHGPVYKTGRIKPGDRLLRVDKVSLIGKTLEQAQQIIKCDSDVSGYTNLTIEYDVSVVQNVDFLTVPLFIEIDRPMNDKLGLVLCDYTVPASDSGRSGVYIGSILPASIADRCGALSVGDQVLAVDDIIIENCACNSDDVMTLLDMNSQRGCTQMQIMPANALRCGMQVSHAPGSLKYGFSTLESPKSVPRKRLGRFARNSSLPVARIEADRLDSSMNTRIGNSSSSTTTLPRTTSEAFTPLNRSTNMSVCRVATFPVLLDCSNGAGIVLSNAPHCGGLVIIAEVVPDSVADRSGCIQGGDRIVAINKMYHPDVITIRNLLNDKHGSTQKIVPHGMQPVAANWVELEIEFDMADCVIADDGIFTVKMMRTGKSGLGISVNGSSHSGVVILDVKPGSIAHRSGSLCAGDILLAVDSHPVHNFNIDALLQSDSRNFTVLTVKRQSGFQVKQDQKMSTPIYSNYPLECDNDPYTSAAVVGAFGEVKFNNCDRLRPTLQSLSQHYLCPSGDETSHTNLSDLYGIRDSNHCTNLDSLYTQNTHNITKKPSEMKSNSEPLPMERFSNVDYSVLPPPMENKEYSSATSSSSVNSLQQNIFSVHLEPNGGALGIMLAGSEDINEPIAISSLVEGGIAYQQGQIQINDQLLAINDESVESMPLSYATAMLQNLGNTVDLKLLRPHNVCGGYNHRTNLLHPHSKVEQQSYSPSASATSNSNALKPTQDDSDTVKYRIYHVTLFKDKVYDDYGFSVSDGLYERGVFINRVRSGGPADACRVLRPFDRILQVNDMKTQDFDCCLTVPLIAAAGDKIELIIQRPE